MGAPDEYQPYQPYLPQQPPSKKSNTTRNALLIIIGCIILLCGGCYGAMELLTKVTGSDQPKTSTATTTPITRSARPSATAAPAPTRPVDTDAIITSIAQRDAFFDTLDGMDIQYTDQDEMVALAGAVCLVLAERQSWTLLDATYDMSQSRPEFTGEQAAGFVGLAVAAYCPEMESRGWN